MPKKSSDKITNQEVRAAKDKKPSPVINAMRSIIFSPVFNVAALVLLFSGVFIGLRIVTARAGHGQIKFIERPNLETDERAANEDRVYPSQEIFKGEVYDTSIRLRETGALGMAISLVVFASNTEQGSVPPNLERIWSMISERNLMPPGLQLSNGELVSPSSAITVRYQAQPLRFEILSRPKDKAEGAAILLRFPLNSLDRRTITYFQSSSVRAYDVPAPFAPFEKIVSAGWTIEQWRGELLPKTDNQTQILELEKQHLDQMAKTR